MVYNKAGYGTANKLVRCCIALKRSCSDRLDKVEVNEAENPRKLDVLVFGQLYHSSVYAPQTKPVLSKPTNVS